MVEKKKELLKKTDQAVKTTESWGAFFSGISGFFATVTVFSAAMTAAIVEVFEFVSAYGWAGWVLAAFPAALVVALLCLALAWIWHFFPKGWGKNKEEIVGGAKYTDFVDSTDKTDEIRANLTQKLDKDRAAHEKKLDEVSQKLTALDQRIDTLKNHMAINFGAVAEMHEAQRLLKDFEPLTDKLKAQALSLTKLPMTENWHVDFKEWERLLNRWCQVGGSYRPEICKEIIEVNTDSFKSDNWTSKVNEISNSDDQLAYKKFKLLERNFSDFHGEVLGTVQYRAWNTFSGQGTDAKYVRRFEY